MNATPQSPTFTEPRTRVRWFTGRDLTKIRRAGPASWWLPEVGAPKATPHTSETKPKKSDSVTDN